MTDTTEAPRAPIKDQTVVQRPSSAGAKVTVACKLPNGLLIHADKMFEATELVMGGGTREYRKSERVGDYVRINGTRVNPNIDEDETRPLVASGYALTSGVNKDLWDKWAEANKDTPLVKNKLIFAMEREADAFAKAKEHKGNRSGLEPLRIGKDAKGRPLDDRVPSRIQKSDRKEDEAA